MAETVGLVFGGVALVSMLSTFTEIHQYFHDARFYGDDVQLVFTKVNVMKQRLNQWTRSISKETLDEETAKALDAGWPEQRAIQQCLEAMQRILTNTANICYRYRSKEQREATRPLSPPISNYPSHLYLTLNHRASSNDLTETQTNGLGNNDGSPKLKKLLWVFSDKKKIEKLVTDFDFLLNHLEKVTENLRREIVSNCDGKRDRGLYHIISLTPGLPYDRLIRV